MRIIQIPLNNPRVNLFQDGTVSTSQRPCRGMTGTLAFFLRGEIEPIVEGDYPPTAATWAGSN